MSLSQDETSVLLRRGMVIWLTGLSGSGKTTLGEEILRELRSLHIVSACIDGDRLRRTVNRDLGMSPTDRETNVKRAAEIAHMMSDAGVVTVVALTSPQLSTRDYARSLFPKHQFIEAWLDTPLEICRQRDPKGLYKMYDAGRIQNMVGLDIPYEQPVDPEVHLRTDELSVNQCVDRVFDTIAKACKGELACD